VRTRASGYESRMVVTPTSSEKYPLTWELAPTTATLFHIRRAVPRRHLGASPTTRPNGAPPGSQLSVDTPSEPSGCQSDRVLLKGLLGQSEHDRQPLVDGIDDAHGHLRSGVPVVGSHGAALVLATVTGGLVAH